jgi:hypothetical protein
MPLKDVLYSLKIGCVDARVAAEQLKHESERVGAIATQEISSP